MGRSPDEFVEGREIRDKADALAVRLRNEERRAAPEFLYRLFGFRFVVFWYPTGSGDAYWYGVIL